MKALAKIAMLACMLILQGCASNVNLTRSDLDKVGPIVIGHAPTPQLQVKTIAGAALGLLGRLIDNQASKNFQAKDGSASADFGELLTRKFANKARYGITGWPKMKMLDTTVAENRVISGPSAIFNFGTIMLTADDYLHVEAVLTMKDANGKVICDKFRVYNGRTVKRAKHSPDEYVANNARLLREEIEYAAEYLSSDFVNVINASLTAPLGNVALRDK